MNRALLTQQLRGIEAPAAKTARLIHRQRTVVARLEKAGAPAAAEAHRLLRLLEDLHTIQHDRRSRLGMRLLLLTVKLLDAHQRRTPPQPVPYSPRTSFGSRS